MSRRRLDTTDRLRRWADARAERNPWGHGTTGTALLREAADVIDEQDREILRLQGLLDSLRTAKP